MIAQHQQHIWGEGGHPTCKRCGAFWYQANNNGICPAALVYYEAHIYSWRYRSLSPIAFRRLYPYFNAGASMPSA